ncbi:lipoprotein [Streptomyces sannanensis]|uniref:Lipoprotein n=1 Tax=Streptomyces sannanensis TaxID=285536 RepID=A0ABP6SC48_9ACTN
MVVQRHRWRVGAVAGLWAVMAGCAGGGASLEDHGAADPEEAVRRAADVLSSAGSARTRTAMEMAAGGTRLTIRGEGGYDFHSRMGELKVLLPPDPAGVDEHRPITELLTPGALYMKNRGAGVPADKWVRVDTTSLADGNLVTGGATDPLAAAELLRGARSVVYVGETELAGVRVRHYRGVTDISRAAVVAGEQTRGSLVAAAKGFTTDTVPFDAYLDERGRLCKVRHLFSYDNQGRTVAVASTTLLYAFGSPVTVRLPEQGDIYAGKIES